MIKKKLLVKQWIEASMGCAPSDPVASLHSLPVGFQISRGTHVLVIDLYLLSQNVYNPECERVRYAHVRAATSKPTVFIAINMSVQINKKTKKVQQVNETFKKAGAIVEQWWDVVPLTLYVVEYVNFT
jgi:hypothetical protein